MEIPSAAAAQVDEKLLLRANELVQRAGQECDAAQRVAAQKAAAVNQAETAAAEKVAALEAAGRAGATAGAPPSGGAADAARAQKAAADEAVSTAKDERAKAEAVAALALAAKTKAEAELAALRESPVGQESSSSASASRFPREEKLRGGKEHEMRQPTPMAEFAAKRAEIDEELATLGQTPASMVKGPLLAATLACSHRSQGSPARSGRLWPKRVSPHGLGNRNLGVATPRCLPVPAQSRRSHCR